MRASLTKKLDIRIVWAYILYIYNMHDIYTIRERVFIMDIIISNSSGIPIYEQIVAQIKNQILNGVIKEGEALPSMRMLAAELRISLITTKRAYEELEKSGLIETIVGKGCFVKVQNKELLREEYLQSIEVDLQRVIANAKISGVSLKELKEILDELYE